MPLVTTKGFRGALWRLIWNRNSGESRRLYKGYASLPPGSLSAQDLFVELRRVRMGSPSTADIPRWGRPGAIVRPATPSEAVLPKHRPRDLPSLVKLALFRDEPLDGHVEIRIAV